MNFAKIMTQQKPKPGPSPTGGEWTNSISHDPNTDEMTIHFNNGFTATYPNVDANTYQSAKSGSTTKKGRAGSVGAWLHKNPGVMHNYH
jgi:hypothetical protein